MARLSADWDRVQTAKFLISKCDPAPLSGSKTYYTRLWSCKFVREWEVTSNDDAGTDEEVNDTLSEFMLRSERVPQRSERMVVSYVDDKTTISVLPPEPVAAGQTSLAGNLETSRIVWEGLDIHDPSALLRCIAAKVRVLDFMSTLSTASTTAIINASSLGSSPAARYLYFWGGA